MPLIVIAAPHGTIAADDAAREFPLAKGSTWINQGIVRWSLDPASSPDVVELTMALSIEVVEVIARGHVTAAVMRGHPRDRLTPRPLEAVPSEYLLIHAVPGRVYEVRGDAERVA